MEREEKEYRGTLYLNNREIIIDDTLIKVEYFKNKPISAKVYLFNCTDIPWIKSGKDLAFELTFKTVYREIKLEFSYMHSTLILFSQDEPITIGGPLKSFAISKGFGFDDIPKDIPMDCHCEVTYLLSNINSFEQGFSWFRYHAFNNLNEIKSLADEYSYYLPSVDQNCALYPWLITEKTEDDSKVLLSMVYFLEYELLQPYAPNAIIPSLSNKTNLICKIIGFLECQKVCYKHILFEYDKKENHYSYNYWNNEKLEIVNGSHWVRDFDVYCPHIGKGGKPTPLGGNFSILSA